MRPALILPVSGPAGQSLRAENAAWSPRKIPPPASAHPLEERPHPREVRSLPIHPLAARAALEALVEAAHHLGQAIEHLLARGVLERHVAFAAAREGRD